MKKHLRIFSSMVIILCSGAIASAQDFAYTGGFQTFDVLTTGIYNIMAYGAQGGGGEGTSGGFGAQVGGNFSLTAGQKLTILVGEQGSAGNFVGGGGGGGSFVYTSVGFVPLVIAGGPVATHCEPAVLGQVIR